MELDDLDVTSETENPVEDISDDEEETNSPHKVSDERTHKRHRESADESEGMGKETPSNVPLAPAGTSSPAPASSSSTLEGMEVLNVAPLAYQPPPPQAKKLRLSTRWKILKAPARTSSPPVSSSCSEKTSDSEPHKTTASAPPSTPATPTTTRPATASSDLHQR